LYCVDLGITGGIQDPDSYLSYYGQSLSRDILTEEPIFITGAWVTFK